MSSTVDLRVHSVGPLVPPAILCEEIPVTPHAEEVVQRGREQIVDVLERRDDRLVVVVGPCSVHDPKAALEYASKLKAEADAHRGELLVVMRVYFEKPRTTVGWKGLINDPDLDGSFRINKGLRIARQLLRDICELGLPVATEFLDPITPQFISGLVAWGAIGARTTESQVHRELASGLSMPVGFKNGTGGTVEIAVDAVLSSMHPHRFLGVTEQGLAGIVSTKGNPSCHVILRGGSTGPNYGPEHIARATVAMQKAGLLPNLMVDCSHGNSSKDYRRQPEVAKGVAQQVSSGERNIMGVMVESFLTAGNQKLGAEAPLLYGQSVTDACLGWEATGPVLDDLAEAVRARRQTKA